MVVVAGALICLATITAFTVLILNGKDTSQLALFVGGASATILPQLFALQSSHKTNQNIEVVKDQTQETRRDLKAVKDQILEGNTDEGHS